MDTKNIEEVVNQLENEKAIAQAIPNLSPEEKETVLRKVNAERKRIGMDCTATDKAIEEITAKGEADEKL